MYGLVGGPAERFIAFSLYGVWFCSHLEVALLSTLPPHPLSLLSLSLSLSVHLSVREATSQA